VIELFRTSVEEVFSDSFGLETEPCESLPKEKGFTAQIPFSDGSRDFIAHIWIEEAALKRLAGILLFDEDPDRETLEDLTAELANFIVGHAKMVASDRDLPYRMQTPAYTGEAPLESGENTLMFKVGGRCVAVQIKESHG
jgi:hypothetical protein